MRGNDIFGVQDEGKIAGLCSYFFVLGWAISYFGYHKTEKTSLSSFHLRQTLLLYLTYIATRYGVLIILDKCGVLNGMYSLGNLVIFVNLTFVFLWIYGLIGASNGQEKPIPVLGKPAQLIFAAI
ncbi:hypothetical protein KXD93_17230 [Mucilaginibacter sp. BJC16-A38]|uniref:hypothetical protein n=1 Tax=Mucilaginibacter phenanthrenivorans TaxID=1234842 RepID=UPI0021585B8F|nr:hypothetical protein [Mucilaginibacter phenanthrenivorans]MCR8559403.1 hypothetical protein [Mucilaginibacter phenanthrenivorans]